ncbi:hypothetical protein [Streptomyces liangshanensis]|uniref:hypothetical protein n=1 Tax=Streptomyces liangshanensis TaxID=2717324 RepID=UPI0036D8C5B4
MITCTTWTAWPSREALTGQGRTDSRRRIAHVIRLFVLGGLFWSTFARDEVAGWGAAAATAGLLVVAACWSGSRCRGRIRGRPSRPTG